MDTFIWLFLLASLIWLVTISWFYRAINKQQNDLVGELQGQRFWRIQVATPTFVERPIHFYPAEGGGVLVDEGDSVLIKGYWRGGKSPPIEQRFAKAATTAQWMGKNGSLFWARLTDAHSTLCFSVDQGRQGAQSGPALSDLFRSVFPEVDLTNTPITGVSLEDSPQSLGVAATFFVFTVFAVVDTFAVNRFELTPPQTEFLLRQPMVFGTLMVVALIFLLIAYRFLTRAKVPSLEALTLSALCTGALLAVSIPMLKRVDQYMDSAGLQKHTYLASANGTWVPQDQSKGLPPL